MNLDPPDLEWAARVIAHHEGITFPPRSECSPGELDMLRGYETRAAAAARRVPHLWAELLIDADRKANAA